VRLSLIGHSHFLNPNTCCNQCHLSTSSTCLHVIPSLSYVLHCALLNSLIFPMCHSMFFTAFYFWRYTLQNDHACLFKIIHVNLYKNSTSITDTRIPRKKKKKKKPQTKKKKKKKKKKKSPKKKKKKKTLTLSITANLIERYIQENKLIKWIWKFSKD